MLPTRGVRGPGFGPAGRGAGRAAGAAGAAASAAGAAGAGAAAAGAADSTGAGSGAFGAAGFGAAGLGAATASAGASGTSAAAFFGAAFFAGAFLAAGLASPPAAGNDSRNRRATGASTVDEADLTNSPCSFRRSSTCLLVTPSSLASSWTRALPGTALLTWRSSGGPATTSVYCRNVLIVVTSRCAHVFYYLSGFPGVSRVASLIAEANWSANCSGSTIGTLRPMSRRLTNAAPTALRRIACRRHCGSGCSQAPRPGKVRR